MPKHGGDFWNSMISLLSRGMHSRLPLKMKDHLLEDKDYQKKRPKWPVFYWQNVGCGSYRLCIDKSGIDKSSQSYQERPLYIYSDLVQTQIIGGSETDLLREVIYKGSKSTFEPHNLQFKPIRKNKFDTLEIGISETDGTQTEFLNSNDETVVTLCFRRK